MVYLTEGLTPTEYLTIINNNLKENAILDGLLYSSFVAITDAMYSGDIITNLNNNLSEIIGYNGIDSLSWINNINNSFATKIPYLGTFTNVADYGAYNDGTHGVETQQAFQDCADIGGRIYVPDGLYLINSTVTVRGVTDILGIGNPEIHQEFDYLSFTSDSLDNTLDISFDNLIMTGIGGYDPNNYDTNPSENAIYLQADSTITYVSCEVRNCHFEDLYGGGIQAKGFENVLFENCSITNSNFVAYTPVAVNSIIINCTSDNVMMFSECSGIGNNSVVQFTDCIGTNLVIYGIRFYGNGNLVVDNCQFNCNTAIPHLEGWGFNFEPSIITDYISGNGIRNILVNNCSIDGWKRGVWIYSFDVIGAEIEKLEFRNFANTNWDEYDYYNENATINELIM